MAALLDFAGHFSPGLALWADVGVDIVDGGEDEVGDKYDPGRRNLTRAEHAHAGRSDTGQYVDGRCGCADVSRNFDNAVALDDVDQPDECSRQNCPAPDISSSVRSRSCV